MSLALAVARGTDALPHQSLKQEMALLGLTIPTTNQVRTAYPAKLEADGVGADASSLDRIGEKA
jgi:hypothetical protein